MAAGKAGSKPSHVSPLVALRCLDSYLSAVKDAAMEIRLGSLLQYMVMGNTDPPAWGVHWGAGSPICSRAPQQGQGLILQFKYLTVQFRHKY